MVGAFLSRVMAFSFLPQAVTELCKLSKPAVQLVPKMASMMVVTTLPKFKTSQ